MAKQSKRAVAPDLPDWEQVDPRYQEACQSDFQYQEPPVRRTGYPQGLPKVHKDEWGRGDVPVRRAEELTTYKANESDRRQGYTARPFDVQEAMKESDGAKSPADNEFQHAAKPWKSRAIK